MKNENTHLGTVLIGKPMPLAPPAREQYRPVTLDIDFVIANVRAVLAERNLVPNRLASMMNGKYDNLNPWISRFMNGKVPRPELKMLFSIANALDVPIERIVGNDYLKQL